MKQTNYILIKTIIKAIISWPIDLIISLTNIDLLDVALKNLGIGVHYEYNKSGEKYFVNSVLKKFIKTSKPIFFDVGANLGTYSSMLNKAFPHSTIHAFEPNPFMSEKLKALSANNTNIKNYNKALGDKDTTCSLYIDNNDHLSQLASINRNIYTELHKINDLNNVSIEMTTVDSFTKSNNIQNIDFIKIDTEGNELDVLVGARQRLNNNNISVIQFEFNEMNVINRIFLKDFYEILPNYSIFRLARKRLIPLPKYQTNYEIFRFQNIIAIRKDLLGNIR